tara:strand:+ start:798 stop:1448 length:651 start_codon:yes stop_codon:yes gene_type:complete
MCDWERIKKHLISNDKNMVGLIELYGKPTLLNSLIPEINLFDSLVNSIISQQLSVKVVKNIKGKLYGLCAVEKFDPDMFIKLSYEELRNCGLSKAKSDYTKGLAYQIKKNPEFLKAMINESDEKVIMDLVKIKGIGIWTAQMFLLFALKRLDVFSPKDAGLMRGVKLTYFNGISPNINELERIINRWVPYRSIGSWYMWQVANAQPSISAKSQRVV